LADQGWIDVGRLDDVPRRGSRRVRGPDASLPIAVFRTADDRVYALLDRCPHKGGPLSEGIVQGCAVACPLHGWVIQLDSGEAEAPDEGRVPVIPVKLENGRIRLLAPELNFLVRDPEAA
jgi:nitrite reductase (NADH) small subunit